MIYTKVDEDGYLVIPENQFDVMELKQIFKIAVDVCDNAIEKFSKKEEFSAAIAYEGGRAWRPSATIDTQLLEQGTKIVLSKFLAQVLKVAAERRASAYFAEMVIKHNLTCTWPDWLPEYPGEDYV